MFTPPLVVAEVNNLSEALGVSRRTITRVYETSHATQAVAVHNVKVGRNHYADVGAYTRFIAKDIPANVVGPAEQACALLASPALLPITTERHTTITLAITANARALHASVAQTAAQLNALEETVHCHRDNDLLGLPPLDLEDIRTTAQDLTTSVDQHLVVTATVIGGLIDNSTRLYGAFDSDDLSPDGSWPILGELHAALSLPLLRLVLASHLLMEEMPRVDDVLSQARTLQRVVDADVAAALHRSRDCDPGIEPGIATVAAVAELDPRIDWAGQPSTHEAEDLRAELSPPSHPASAALAYLISVLAVLDSGPAQLVEQVSEVWSHLPRVRR